MKRITDALLALQYDTCEKLESCEPCKGVRDMAITEIKTLRTKLSRVREWAESTKHGTVAAEILRILNDE